MIFIKDQCVLQISANYPNQGESIPRISRIRARNICKLISFSVLDTVLTIYWVEDTVWVEKEAGQEMNGTKLVSAGNALHKNTHCLHYIARYSLLDHNAFVPIGENIFASVKNLC